MTFSATVTTQAARSQVTAIARARSRQRLGAKNGTTALVPPAQCGLGEIAIAYIEGIVVYSSAARDYIPAGGRALGCGPVLLGNKTKQN